MIFHAVEARAFMLTFDAWSKFNTTWRVRRDLVELGRTEASGWPAKNVDATGERSTLDLARPFGDSPTLPTRTKTARGTPTP